MSLDGWQGEPQHEPVAYDCLRCGLKENRCGCGDLALLIYSGGSPSRETLLKAFRDIKELVERKERPWGALDHCVHATACSILEKCGELE